VPRDDGWSVGAVRERCQNLKASLQYRASVPAAEVDRFWPGGAENPEQRGRGAWLFCYASLARLMGRAEAAQAAGTNQDTLLDALAALPVAVTVVEGTTFQCHPKSYLALRWMAQVDRLLSAMLDVAARIPLMASEQQEELREEARIATVELQLALLWAAVHPGPGLPFDDRELLPAIPEPIRAISPLGIYQVLRAYRTANLQGLAALPALTDGELDGTRPSFAMWFASLATESGLSADVLMRERPLTQLLAQARLSALAREPKRAA
jgi:hypothetical protein